MRATKPGGQRARRLSARPPGEPGELLVHLVTRLVVAQTIAAAAVGLPFSKRQLSSILITLAMVAALCVLAFLVRSGTKTAWLVAVGFDENRAWIWAPVSGNSADAQYLSVMPSQPFVTFQPTDLASSIFL